MWFYGYLPVFARGVGLYIAVSSSQKACEQTRRAQIQVACGKESQGQGERKEGRGRVVLPACGTSAGGY